MGVTIIMKPKPPVSEAPAVPQEPTVPAPEPIEIKVEAQPPQTPPKGSQTILEAMEAFVRQEQFGELYIVHKVNGLQYQVLDFDLKTRYARLKSPTGSRLNPRMSERECAIYYPLWR